MGLKFLNFAAPARQRKLRLRASLRRAGKNFNSFFFAEEPDSRWGFFCAAFSLITIEYLLNKPLGLVETNPYYSLPLFELFGLPPPHAAKDFLSELFGLELPSLRSFFERMRLIVCGAMALAALGLAFQKFFIALSLVSFFLYQGWIYGFIRSEDNPYVYHSLNIVCFILLVWLIAPSIPRWRASFWMGKLYRMLKKSRRPRLSAPAAASRFLPLSGSRCCPAWPRLLIIFSISAAYFGSFYCKLAESGFRWIDGHTLQAYLLTAGIAYPLSYGGWLAQQNFYLIWALNIGIWVFQSTAPLGFLHPKTRLLYAFAGAGFHLSVFLFLGFPFIPFQWYYVIFLPEVFQFAQKHAAGLTGKSKASALLRFRRTPAGR